MMNEELFIKFIAKGVKPWAKEKNHQFVQAMCSVLLKLYEEAGYERTLKCFRVLLFNDNSKFFLTRAKNMLQ